MGCDELLTCLLVCLCVMLAFAGNEVGRGVGGVLTFYGSYWVLWWDGGLDGMEWMRWMRLMGWDGWDTEE